MVKRGINVTETPLVITVERASLGQEQKTKDYANLHSILKEIREKNEILGFILKGSAYAAIDLDHNEDLAKFAILVSQLANFSKQVLNLHEEAFVRSVVLEGKELKVLCLNIRGNEIGIMMKKSNDDKEILNKILS